MSFNCKCKIIKQVYARDDFRIFGCVPLDESPVKLSKYHNFTITGSLGMLEQGNEYTLELEETTGKYGLQYNVISVPSFDTFDIKDINDLDDKTELTMLNNIMSPSQAQYMNDAYPNFIRKCLLGEEKDIDYHNIYNVAEYRLNSYIEKVNSLFKYFKLMNDNKDFELNYGDCTKICEQYSSIELAQKSLNINPYLVLCGILDWSFPKADNVVLKARPKFKDSDVRCEYLMLHLLKENENDGNTRILGNILATYVNDWDNELLKRMKNVAINSPNIYYDTDTKDLSIMGTYLAECSIAYELKYRLDNPRVLDIDYMKYQHGEFDLTDEQMGILKLMCEQDVAMLVGYSGSGKSTTVQAIVSLLEDNDLTYTLLAPTGIASRRLKETTHRSASTIHKKLANDGIIDTDVVLIDEVSMVGVELFAHLLTSLAGSTKVIMVCDNEQLASISCGNIVTDILKSNKKPVAKLTKVCRYGTAGLAPVATDIRNGQDYLSHSIDKFNDYKFIPIEPNPINQIIEEYKKLLDSYSYKDILVLSPFNVGTFGTYAINSRIQAEVNPPKPNENFMIRKIKDAPNGEILFRVGDKVINKKNNYNAKTEDYIEFNRVLKQMEYQLEDIKEFDGEFSDEYYDYMDRINEYKASAPNQTFIMNGEIGYIKAIDKEKNVYVQFEEVMIVCESADLQNLLLAYAISIHGVQGAESQAVMVITHPQHKKLLTKNLLYVADTRAKNYLVEIGDKATINHALSISETQNRKTWLYDLLIKEGKDEEKE